MWRIIAIMLLILGCALLGFEHVALDNQRYTQYQETLNLSNYVGISKPELQHVQQTMAAYLAGKASESELNQTVTMRGTQQPIFNDREMAHMRDVLHLFELERRVKTISLAAGMILLIPALLSKKHTPTAAFSGLIALGAWLVAGIAFAAACGFNFDAIFIRFHELLFTNDLWLLDPATDAMIRMYPTQFFMWMARDIGIYMGLCALIPTALPFLLPVTRRKGV